MIISMSAELEVEVLVVGAGIVGLTVAAALAERVERVVVVERQERFGLGISSRSSEVVHAGLYYPSDSWKARLCIEGATLVHERCARLEIGLARRGKLVVAGEPDQEELLLALFDNARESGARDLELWGSDRMAHEEPRLPVSAAIWSPWTAVVDSVELMRSYAVEARESGVDFAYRHRLVGLDRRGDRWVADIIDPEGSSLSVVSAVVVNAAGLGSDEVAAMAGIDLSEAGYELQYCKGDYFALSGRAVRGLTRLVYPLPDPDLQILGVHLTLDVTGQGRLGPDATYLDGRVISYLVEESKRSRFLEAGRRIMPWLENDDLSPERAGVRPRLHGLGEGARDFVICHEVERDRPGLVNLIGIESPGLTSAPAIARQVTQLLHDAGLI